MADVTRQYTNQMKRNIQESEAFICITYHKGVGFKISSNLNGIGQLRLLTDAGEKIRRDVTRYIPQKEAQDEPQIRTPDDDGGRDEEG